MRTGVLVSLFCLVAGCGSRGAGPVDAASDDAPDAEVADAPPRGAVHVTTRSRCCIDAPGVLVPGIEIVVTEPDGTIETAVTDANGEATVEIVPGASVTAFYADALPNSALSTVLDVQPGDALVFGTTWRDSSEPSIGTMTFDWPADASLERVDVYHACGSNYGNGTDGTITNLFYASCAPAFDDVVFVARNLGTIVKWGVVTGQTFVDNGTVTLPAWQDAGSLAMSVTGLPPEVMQVLLRADMTIGEDWTYNESDLPDGVAAGTVPWAPMGDGLRVLARLQQGSPDYGSQYVLLNRPPDTTEVTIADPITMPWMSAGVAGYDDARSRPEWHFPELSWLMGIPDGTIRLSGSPLYE